MRRSWWTCWGGTTLVVATTLACGGSSPAEPRPAYPAMTGAWTGTLTLSELTGVIKNTCAHMWTVTNQTGNTFAGTSLTSGTCRVTPGQLLGTVSENGAVSFGFDAFPRTGCTLVSGGTYAGTISGSSLLATTTQTVQCPGGGPFTELVTISVTK